MIFCLPSGYGIRIHQIEKLDPDILAITWIRNTGWVTGFVTFVFIQHSFISGSQEKRFFDNFRELANKLAN